MDNGILQVTISKPEGIVTGVSYQGIDNLLEIRNHESDRGYWDLVWSEEGTGGTTGTSYVYCKQPQKKPVLCFFFVLYYYNLINKAINMQNKRVKIQSDG
ncbi:hypothetical protein ERO13_D06G029950v2 [Gossypium hirsutum]|nr:hypothetical protein ERO13_D06G029950v2 [Gossypium hirsutum]